VSGALRVGIDVGGTFTDVVVVDAASRAIVARVKVPTTHDAPEGVAAGIVAGLRRALEAPGVDAERIAFIAHSTTQATNALLEGDVANVGVVGLHGRFGWFERGNCAFRRSRSARAPAAPHTVFARAGDATPRSRGARESARGRRRGDRREPSVRRRPAGRGTPRGGGRARARGARDRRARSREHVRSARAHAHRGAQRRDSAAHAAHGRDDGAVPSRARASACR
jgi:hypothetical protein